MFAEGGVAWVEVGGVEAGVDDLFKLFYRDVAAKEVEAMI